MVASVLAVGVAGLAAADRRIESHLEERVEAEVQRIRSQLADGELFRVLPSDAKQHLESRGIDTEGPVRASSREVTFEIEESSWWRRPCVRVAAMRDGSVTARTRSQTGC